MRKIMIKLFAITFLMLALPLLGSKSFGAGSMAVAADFPKDPFPLKNSKHYDESKDPAFRRCGTNSEGPQHGYFAVPLLVLGISGALIYFLKND